MPIYEFKCMQCGEFLEFLVMNPEETVEMKCRQCGGEQLERVLSTTHYNMAAGGTPSERNASVQTRNCSSGSCTTYELPGHSR